jgi:hypothetical protein
VHAAEADRIRRKYEQMAAFPSLLGRAPESWWSRAATVVGYVLVLAGLAALALLCAVALCAGAAIAAIVAPMLAAGGEGYRRGARWIETNLEQSTDKP